jgi:hypothetical protein
VLSERFAATSTYQYYHKSPLLYDMGEVVLMQLFMADPPFIDMPNELSQALEYANYVDMDWDTISQTFVFTAVWPPEGSQHAPLVPFDPLLISPASLLDRRFRRSRKDQRVETGILQPEVAKETEQLSLGGFLTVLGEDDHPDRTLFSFPARHHPLPPSTPATFSASFQSPTGLHPKLQLTLPRQHLSPPKDSCSLHAYWTLPSAIFIDRYQLSDHLFLASQNLIKLHSLSGEQDLEAPDWVINKWGSAALLELATPPPSAYTSKGEDWTITIPTHLRYLTSHTHTPGPSGTVLLDVPWPVVFWACEAEEGLKMATNPFDRVNLGYDGLFGPKTMFYHIPPASGGHSTMETLQVPILDQEMAEEVSVGTMAVVLVGLIWVCWMLIRSPDVKGLPRKGDSKKKQ